MELRDYFENTKGVGILATANAQGNVDVALYGRPHVLDEKTVCFIMSDRLSHENLQSNPHAAYLFLEQDAGYLGRRLYLTKTAEEIDAQKIESLRRKTRTHTGPDFEKFLVTFHIDHSRPAVGGETVTMTKDH
jgi:hypothetical protein